MEFEKLQVKLDNLAEGKEIGLYSEELDCSINLENSESGDLKEFFDKIFEYVLEKEKLIDFELKNMTDKALFQNVAEDLVKQINSEIRDSETNFDEIISLKSRTMN
ncbi:hypothetical protein [Streptococcus sobrinus]|uniref:hypothetical protein n=1 Tax=Streptococcus sobrinus TaxID=1310 RepID=UPI000D7058E7|nr:hypothetical protein [Streptococcus sobrinus]AWN60780.1 hypothetical protein DLJ52_00405 [Streptococcus sobrinus]AWN62652.1 hypothetical protein DLJ51_00405 [Streptococcus sobrinus]SQG18384.1 Uncharacterised protein [Streptococcus sobrinus]